jgi:hypothetical protein
VGDTRWVELQAEAEQVFHKLAEREGEGETISKAGLTEAMGGATPLHVGTFIAALPPRRFPAF